MTDSDSGKRQDTPVWYPSPDARVSFSALTEALLTQATAGLSDEEVATKALSLELELQRITDEAGHRLADELIARAPRMLEEHRHIQSGFEGRLRERYGRAFDLFYNVAVCAEEMGEAVRSLGSPAAAQADDHVFRAVTLLHARACLTAFEVHALLRTGFPTAAHGRRRTLHELAVVSRLLGERGRSVGLEDLAERFLLHHRISDVKDAREYEAHAEMLGAEPFSEEALAEMQAQSDALVQRFGREYKANYGWAAPLAGGKVPTFRQLEQIAGLNYLRPFYRWASHGVHPGSKGVMLNIYERGPTAFALTGPVNIGLTDPGHGALISLLQSTTTVALYARGHDFDAMDLVGITAMQELVERAGSAFLEAEAAVRRDEDQLWSQRRD